MNRWIRYVAWLFFAATAYCIAAEALRPWLYLPSPGNIGFTIVFVLFALTHCAAVYGPRRTAVFFSVSAIVSYFMEEVGVRTGRVFGAYHYSALLGARLGHVPILIPLAWFMMVYPSWKVAQALLRGSESDSSLLGITALSCVGAAVMTGWDVVMDPGMAAAGNWVWEHGGTYFGVPLRNYAGWLLTTFLVYWIAGWLGRTAKRTASVDLVFASLPVLVYALFALRYITAADLPPLHLVAVFSMGMPALLALLELFLYSRKSAA